MHIDNIQLAMGGYGDWQLHLSIALVYLFQAREITEILNFQTPKGKKYFMAFVTSEPVDKYQACF